MSLRFVPVNTWLRALRTTRHLRSSQIVYRLRRIVGQRLARHRPRLLLSSDERPYCVPKERMPIVPEFSRGCVDSIQLIAELDRGSLSLVNRSLPMSVESPDWRLGSRQEDRLWAITLHYHAWLYELSKLVQRDHPLAGNADQLLRSFLTDWLDACRPGQAGVEALAWNSYAIATRLAWWARIWHLLGQTYWHQHPTLAARLQRSMYEQAAHLAANIEWDLRANHLLRDAVGLAWAGNFFPGNQPARWLALAEEIAVTQAEEQTLRDGGHFERSPFYHLEVMNDWLALERLLPAGDASNTMRQTWQRAAEYARWLCHPDGRVAQFNDGAAALAAPHLAHGESLSQDVGAATPRGGRWLEDSGVVAWHGEQWALFWDVGEVGPDYQPGHAHADTLAIEASYQGRRLFVDPGCHSYDNDARRQYDRSTLAHNTVSIDGQDSSEVWHIFRVGRRARPQDVTVEVRRDGFVGAASHSGYVHLAGAPSHERQISVTDQTHLAIIDRVTGDGRHEIEGGLLVHPDWDVAEDQHGWLLRCDHRRLRVTIKGNEPLVITTEIRPLHPDYGVEVPTKRLTWRFTGLLPLIVHMHVEPTNATPGNPGTRP